MDNGRLAVLNERQIACHTLDVVNRILRLVIQHLVTQLNAKQHVPSDGLFRGFDLKQVV